MTDIRINCFFCEDVRLDNEGKPMLIGVLAPAAWADEAPLTIDQLKYMSIFYVSRSVEQFQAKLSLLAEGEVIGFSGGERQFNRTFTRPKDLEDDEEEWMVLSHLSLRDLTFSDKARLRAILRVNHQRVESSLQVRIAGPSGQTTDNTFDAEDINSADTHT